MCSSCEEGSELLQNLQCMVYSNAMCRLDQGGSLPFCDACDIGEGPVIPTQEQIDACVGAASAYKNQGQNCEQRSSDSSDSSVGVGPDSYKWEVHNPSKCDKRCGNTSGEYSVNVACVRERDGKIVTDDNCDTDTKPEDKHTVYFCLSIFQIQHVQHVSMPTICNSIKSANCNICNLTVMYSAMSGAVMRLSNLS